MNIKLLISITLSWSFITTSNLKASVDKVLQATKLTPEEAADDYSKCRLEDEKKDTARIAAQISAALSRGLIQLTPDEQAAIKKIMDSLNRPKDQVIEIFITKPNICWRTKMGNHGNYFPYQNLPDNECSCKRINENMTDSVFNIQNVMDKLIQTKSICTDPEEIDTLKQQGQIWNHPTDISWHDVALSCGICKPNDNDLKQFQRYPGYPKKEESGIPNIVSHRLKPSDD